MTERNSTETGAVAMSETDLEKVHGGLDGPKMHPMPTGQVARPRTGTTASLLSMDEGCAM